MPISGGSGGISMSFETETETVPSAGNLVIGDGKLLTAWSSNGILALWRQEGGPGGGGWVVTTTPAGDDLDIGANMSMHNGLIGIEAAMWRLENAVAAVRTAYLSVINVG